MAYLTPDIGGGVTLCRRLRFRSELAEIVTGTLEKLIHAGAYEQFGTMTPEQAAGFALEMLNDYMESDDMCRIGTVVEYITQDAPEGVLALDGTTYNGADYPDLFARLDSAFLNGDGTFTLPDARGRTAVFDGAGSGLTARSIGDIVGAESVTLTIAEMPGHTHTDNEPAGTTLADPLVGTPLPAANPAAPNITGSTGGGGAHENMQPSIVWKVGVWWK